jgi:hypothetical protein
MTKREKTGAALIAFPFVGLPLSLTLYAIFGFVIAQLIASQGQAGDPTSFEVVGRIVSMLLGLLGVASLIGFFVAIPIGIYLLAVPAKKKTA